MINARPQFKLIGLHAVLLLGLFNSIGQALVFHLRNAVPVFWIIAIQSSIACLVVVLLSIGNGQLHALYATRQLHFKDWLLLHTRSLICAVGGLGLIYGSYAYLPLTVVSWFMAIPLASIWAYFLLGETISGKDLIALLMSVTGLLIISSEKSGNELHTHWYGLMLITLGILLFSLGWVLSRKIITAFGERNYTILSTATIGFYSWIVAAMFFDFPALNGELMALLLLRGLLLGFVTILFARTVRCLKITKGLVIARLENLYILLIGICFFGEQLSVSILLGGCLVLASSVVSGRA